MLFNPLHSFVQSNVLSRTKNFNMHNFPTAGGFYCMLYNLLDFPAVSVPVTRETQSDQDNLSTYEATDLLHEIVKKVIT